MHIYEYNPEHRERMKFILQDIHNNERCDVCDKMIMKHIWRLRRTDMICCSSECVDEYNR